MPLEIIRYPHPTLRHTSKTIKRVDAELRRIVREMFDRMYEAQGVGLAANQVGLPLRLFVVNLEGQPGAGEELVFLNPVISMPRGSSESEEGCLSLPGLYGPVVRPKQVRISAYNLSGEEFRGDLNGLFARVVQHELDHLDGVLFTDRMSEEALEERREKLLEFERDYETARQAGQLPSIEENAAHLAEWESRYC